LRDPFVAPHTLFIAMATSLGAHLIIEIIFAKQKCNGFFGFKQSIGKERWEQSAVLADK
jgi:hypothetical protein